MIKILGGGVAENFSGEMVKIFFEGSKNLLRLKWQKLGVR